MNDISDKVALEIAAKFPTVGGGFEHKFKMPFTELLKDKPLMFAAGVDVAEVVEFILSSDLIYGYFKGLHLL